MSCDTDSTEKKIGNVKWFNNKAGYGFITMNENTETPVDVFVHFSNISVSNSQYKYLVQGEYVEFTLAPASEESSHEFQAVNVTGIQGGATLCERRRLSRESSLDDEDRPVREKRTRPSDEDAPRSRRPVRRTRDDAPAKRPPRAPRESKSTVEDADGFTRVVKKSAPKPLARTSSA